MKFRPFLPETRRQWVGFVIGALTLLMIVTQGTWFAYRQRLKTIEEREWKYWSRLAKESESAVVVVDAATGKITGWNSAATTLLGWEAAEVAGSRFTFLVPSEYILESYGSLDSYFDRVIDPSTRDRLTGTVLAVKGKINTKPGVRRDCRISIRTIGTEKLAYVVTIDPVERVEEIKPPVEVTTVPEVPQAEPKREPQ